MLSRIARRCLFLFLYFCSDTKVAKSRRGLPVRPAKRVLPRRRAEIPATGKILGGMDYVLESSPPVSVAWGLQLPAGIPDFQPMRTGFAPGKSEGGAEDETNVILKQRRIRVFQSYSLSWISSPTAQNDNTILTIARRGNFCCTILTKHKNSTKIKRI